MSERDTRFQGFAKRLYEDFFQLAREDESSINEMLRAIPDLTEWPKETE